jgi:histidinol phosphatase-like PHP family hydrolase
MRVNSRNHIYRYTPDFLNNRRLPKEKIAEQIIVKLRGITSAEEDAEFRESQNTNRMYAPDKAQEINEARMNKLYSEKFVGVEGMEIDGLEGKELDFETFYAEAPTDIVREVVRVLRSTEALTVGEQKNFLPESGGL